MFKRIMLNFLIVAIFSLCTVLNANAKVSADEAARLGKDLTPLGAERAGNADGSIPEWDGGLTGVPDGIKYKKGDFYPNPFPDDMPLYRVTARNLEKHKQFLNPGQITMFKKYPDTYYLNIYKTRRTQAAPQWVYDVTKHNAVNADTTEDGQGVIGNVKGGIMFPIPKNGYQVMYNHLGRWEGIGRIGMMHSGVVFPDKGFVAGGGGRNFDMYPRNYNQGNASEKWQHVLFLNMVEYLNPPNRNGEYAVVRDYVNAVDSPREAWQYLPGQRRVRRAPTLGWDTPNPSASGLQLFDESHGFSGSFDRYNLKLVEKKEMYIPYNNYAMLQKPLDGILTANFANPDIVRWEKHRVWIVEATLKEGSRHTYPRRTFYFDEDSWCILLTDIYDGHMNLWRTQTNLSYCAYDIPGVVLGPENYYDLTDTKYYSVYAQNGFEKMWVYYLEQTLPDDFYTPENIRRRGRR